MQLRVKQQMRWIFRYVEEARQDVRHTVRSLRRTPGFTIIAVLTLALGIGANTALFSVANAVLIKPLSVTHPERLVRSVTDNNGVWMNGSPATFKVWKDADAIFEDVSAHRVDIVNLTGNPRPQQIGVARVSHAFLRLFDAPLLRGRAFTTEEDRPGGPAVAILSYPLWMRQYGGDESILGRRLMLGNVSHAIVGVIGPGFNSEQFEPLPDVWVPLQADADHVDGASIYQVTARLRPGASQAQADAYLRGALDAFNPNARAGRSGRTYAWIARPLQDAMVASFRTSLNLLAGAVGLLLLIACANVAGLVLVRTDVRRREMAIRAAIGAGRSRILRQLLIESVVLSLIGGAVGIIMGPLIVRSFVGLYPSANPFMIGADEAIPRIGGAAGTSLLDWRVLGFASMGSVGAGIVSGLLPAWHAFRALSHSVLQHTTASASGMRWLTGRAALVLTELGLALVLVVGAGLLIRTSLAMRSVDPGFDPNHVLTMRMSVTGTKFETRDGIAELAREGITSLQQVPGVIRASTTCCMPLETVWQLPFVIASRAGEGLVKSGAMSFHGMGGWTLSRPDTSTCFAFLFFEGEISLSKMTRELRASPSSTTRWPASTGRAVIH